MYCRHCGKMIADESNFCFYCGGKMEADETEEEPQESVPDEQGTAEISNGAAQVSEPVQQLQQQQQIQQPTQQQFQQQPQQFQQLQQQQFQQPQQQFQQPQNGYPQYQQYNVPPMQPMYNQNMYAQNNQPRYKSLSQVPVTATFFIAVLMILSGFIGIFTNWLYFSLKIGKSYDSIKYEQDVKLYEMIDYDDDSYENFQFFLEDKNVRKSTSDDFTSKSDMAHFAYIVMIIAGCLGYVSLALALLMALIAKNNIKIFTILATIQFLLALIASIVCCAYTKSVINDFFHKTISVSLHPSVGIYISLAAAIMATILASNDLKVRKSMVKR